MISELSAGHKQALAKFTATERFYFDPRGLTYPPIATTGRAIFFRHVTPGDNQPGSHVAQLFDAITPTMSAETDLASTWTPDGAVAALSDYYYREQRYTKITGDGTSAQARIYAAAGDSDGGLYSFSIKFRRGNAAISRLEYYDSDAAADRLLIVITWATNTIECTVGSMLRYEWITDNEVEIYARSAVTVNGNATIVYIVADIVAVGTTTAYAYATAFMMVNSDFPLPYTLAARSACGPQYMLPLSTSFSLRIKFRAWIPYDTATYTPMLAWRIDATHVCALFYAPSVDAMRLAWRDGGTSCNLDSRQFDDGSSYINLNTWHTIDIAFNSAGGQTGSALWLDYNTSPDDSDWGGAIDSHTSEFPLLTIGEDWLGYWNGEIAYIWLAPNKVITQADVNNNWADVRDECIVWSMNGHGTGKTRCQITDFVENIDVYDRPAENPDNGQSIANTLALTLRNKSDDEGEGFFSDDQYATFDAASMQYNGTAAQAYLTRQMRVEAETWYGTEWDWLFVGRTNAGPLTRRSGAGIHPYAWISATDDVTLMAGKRQQYAKSYDSHKLSDFTETNSLIHEISRLALSGRVKNYLANASFEISAMSASWTVKPTGATIVQGTTGAVIPTYVGTFTTVSGMASEVYQTVTFTGSKKLNAKQKWTFQIHALDNVARSNVGVSIEERESGSIIASVSGTSPTFTAGGGQKRFSVTHTIVGSTSNAIRVRFVDASLASAQAYALDISGLYEQGTPLDWYAPNNNSGSGGSESADDAVESTYDQIGYDVDYVANVHPWAVVNRGDVIWEHVKEIGVATIARYIGIDECGTFRFRANLATGYEELAALDTVNQPTLVSTSISPFRANKLVGHGIKIMEASYPRAVWSLDDAQFVSRDDAGFANEVVVSGGTFPDESTEGELWAAYGEVRKLPKSTLR